MLGPNITELLQKGFAADRRPPDGKLHPSGDLIGSLRHAQLRAAGAPTVESEIASDTNLMTGTLWHSYFESLFRKNKMPVMTEIKLDPWLPTGWSGTADWLIWSQEYEAFILGDLKTSKAEAMKYIASDGIKEEHMWQLSAYWYALLKMGIPLVKGFLVFYLPKYYLDGAEPLQCEGQPLPESTVIETMEFRWSETQKYLDDLFAQDYLSVDHKPYLSEFLAPEQDRIQKVLANSKMGVMDVKLVKHWSANYCPFPDELCACNTAKDEKIGHYYYDFAKGEVFYLPRKGYQGIVPTVKPTKTQEKQLVEWSNTEVA